MFEVELDDWDRRAFDRLNWLEQVGATLAEAERLCGILVNYGHQPSEAQAIAAWIQQVQSEVESLRRRLQLAAIKPPLPPRSHIDLSGPEISGAPSGSLRPAALTSRSHNRSRS